MFTIIWRYFQQMAEMNRALKPLQRNGWRSPLLGRARPVRFWHMDPPVIRPPLGRG